MQILWSVFFFIEFLSWKPCLLCTILLFSSHYHLTVFHATIACCRSQKPVAWHCEFSDSRSFVETIINLDSDSLCWGSSSFSKWLILTTGLCLVDTLRCELHTKDGSAQGGQWLATTQEMRTTLTWLACLLCTIAFLFWGFVGSLNVYLICQKGVKTGIMCCCCLFRSFGFQFIWGSSQEVRLTRFLLYFLSPWSLIPSPHWHQKWIFFCGPTPLAPTHMQLHHKHLRTKDKKGRLRLLYVVCSKGLLAGWFCKSTIAKEIFVHQNLCTRGQLPEFVKNYRSKYVDRFFNLQMWASAQ